MFGVPCRDYRHDCVNDKNGCKALSSTSWFDDGKCPFYISPERYAKDMELIKQRVGKREATERKVVRIIGEKRTVFNGVREAARASNLPHQNIYRCCNGMAKTCGGYQWEYEEE